jgi:hypothetical protein
MLADQFLEAAAAVKNAHAVDEVARLLWRANAEGRILDVDAEAVSEALQARRPALSDQRPKARTRLRRKATASLSVLAYRATARRRSDKNENANVFNWRKSARLSESELRL